MMHHRLSQGPMPARFSGMLIPSREVPPSLGTWSLSQALVKVVHRFHTELIGGLVYVRSFAKTRPEPQGYDQKL